MRFVRIWRKGRIYEIQALPAADSFRITASTAGVMEVEWCMLQARAVTDKSQVMGSVKVTRGSYSVIAPEDEAVEKAEKAVSAEVHCGDTVHFL